MNKLNIKETLGSIKEAFRSKVIDKINELVNHNNYRYYVALVSQSGTNAPTAVVIKNTLGFVPTFRYDGVGEYAIVSSGKWVANKTACYVINSQATNGILLLSQTDTNDLYLATGDSTTGTNANGILQACTVRIEIYN